MGRTYVDHSCERCGKVRKVSPDKIAKGLQRVCRKCQGPEAAEKRRVAMLKRGGSRRVAYGICKECRSVYEIPASGGDGFCKESCRKAAASRTYSQSELISKVLTGMMRPRRNN